MGSSSLEASRVVAPVARALQLGICSGRAPRGAEKLPVTRAVCFKSKFPLLTPKASGEGANCSSDAETGGAQGFGLLDAVRTSALGKREARGWFALAWGYFRHPLGFILQPQGETSLLSDTVMSLSPCSASESGEQESWAAPAPSPHPCRQLSQGVGE